MDSCIYTKLSFLMRQMPPLHLQILNHELNMSLVHVNEKVSKHFFIHSM